ncbi:MAG: hypothetical protein AB7P21_01930 [Lautropia sp.]
MEQASMTEKVEDGVGDVQPIASPERRVLAEESPKRAVRRLRETGLHRVERQRACLQTRRYPGRRA